MKIFYFQMMFFTVLVMYSAFVLTSIHTDYYKQGMGKFFEYYVYVWAFGDFIEELISCFVCILRKSVRLNTFRNINKIHKAWIF